MFKFTWGPHNQNTKEHFQHLYETHRFSDVTLVTEDQYDLKSHRILLCKSSVIFDKMLNNSLIQNPYIFLRGIKKDEIEKILQFIYMGEVTVKEDKIKEFLSVARDLKIQGIEEEGDYSKSQISTIEDTISEVTIVPEDDPIEEIISNKIDHNSFGPDSDQGKNNSELSTEFEFKNDVNKSDDNQINLESTDKKDKKNPAQMDVKELNQFITKTSNSNWSCNLCDKVLSSKFGMQTHIQAKHNGVKYSCEQCDYQAGQMGQVKLHVRTKHDGITIKYKCEQCDFRSEKMYHLKTHVRFSHQTKKVDSLSSI